MVSVSQTTINFKRPYKFNCTSHCHIQSLSTSQICELNVICHRSRPDNQTLLSATFISCVLSGLNTLPTTSHTPPCWERSQIANRLQKFTLCYSNQMQQEARFYSADFDPHTQGRITCLDLYTDSFCSFNFTCCTSNFAFYIRGHWNSHNIFGALDMLLPIPPRSTDIPVRYLCFSFYTTDVIFIHI